MRHDYLLCGWRVSSAVELPELILWSGAADAPIDITIDAGTLPDRLSPDARPGQALDIDAGGAILLHIKGLVRILISEGTTIVVERLGPASDDGWKLFLLGSALSFLCLQRGLFPLHAACLRMGGQTVAIAGHSGSGKSTLAAALVRRGHALVSDDLAVLRPVSTGAVEVLPSFPRLKLWRKTLDALDMAITGLVPVRSGLQKYDLAPRTGFDPSPVRLDAVVVLGRDEVSSLEPCRATEAVPLLHGYLSRPRAAEQLGLRAATFTQAAAISQAVPVWRLLRVMRFEALAETAELLEARFAS